MRLLRRHWQAGGAVGVALWLVLGAGIRAHQVDDDRTGSDPVLVTVNDYALTERDFHTYQVHEARQRGLRPETAAARARAIVDVTPQAIATAVDELLMAQHARTLGYTFTDALFQQFLSNARGVFRFPGQTEDFRTNDEVLQAIQQFEGLSPQELRRMIEREMLAQQALQVAILDEVALTEAEARAYYDTRIEDYTTPATAALREILIAAPAGTRGTEAESRAKRAAEAVVTRLRHGEDFESLVAELSDSPSRVSEGRIGPLPVTDYSEAVQAAIAELAVGEVSDPIRAPTGYQILRLDLRVDAYVRPFEELRDEITNSVFGDGRNAAYNALLRTLRDQAVIVWHNQELRRAYERHRAAHPTVQASPLQ